MPDWSGYHVKTDGRAYFRFYIPEDLKGVIGPFPMVNLRMKASREAERLHAQVFVCSCIRFTPLLLRADNGTSRSLQVRSG